ncbi:hypothetical protein ACFVXR_30210 [Bacillus thuringiensis]|uniref:hypothetical protein n=1 Tax=Bacillus thuringiensis TaxID=1428 RepID=UPI0036E73A32
MSKIDDYIWEKAILDTDFALKMEKIRKIDAIEMYIPKLVGHLYIHRYVYDNEILVPKRAKDQIDNLISNGFATIVDAETIKKESPLKSLLYQQTIHLLEKSDPETKENGKNWGETVSASYAHIQSIPHILSDEGSFQGFLDEHINSNSANGITVVRIRDFILGMKEKKMKRRDAYAIWYLANEDKSDPKKLERAKIIFHEDLWPKVVEPVIEET